MPEILTVPPGTVVGWPTELAPGVACPADPAVGVVFDKLRLLQSHAARKSGSETSTAISRALVDCLLLGYIGRIAPLKWHDNRRHLASLIIKQEQIEGYNLPSAICHLPSVDCRLSSVVCRLLTAPARNVTVTTAMLPDNERQRLRGSQYRDASNLNARVRLHDLYSTNRQGWMPWLFDHLDFPPHARVLEVGCGPATLWTANANRVPGGLDLTLTDFSEGMLGEARLKTAVSGVAAHFAATDAQALPFPNSCFDVVIANHMLYHVPDRPAALSEIARVLKPEGLFYASTVGVKHLKEMDDMVEAFQPAARPFMWSFTLENGEGQLAPFFERVKLHLYEDALIVSEAAPLVDYVASSQALSPEKLGEFARVAGERIATQGSIYITKASGLFEAEGIRQGAKSAAD